MTKKSKEIVRLRRKKLSNGSYSLYLDIYVDGSRSYEFLKLYLIPEHTDQDRIANVDTLHRAESMRAERETEELLRIEGTAVTKGRMSAFFDYAKRFASRAGISKARSLTINSVVGHLRHYAGDEFLSLSDIDYKWVMGFQSFLNRLPFKQNTRHQYMMVLRSMLKSAKDEELISETPFDKTADIPLEDIAPQYLTIDEIQTISDTPCGSEVVKRAFLFSCLTGIRFKDVKSVTWGQVKRFGKYVRITFTPNKKEEQAYINVTEEALPFLGERGEDAQLVFGALPDNKTVNSYLKSWGKAAGIQKKITFHVARHTFATLLLSLHVKPTQVQKLLGHHSLYSTLKYAEMVRAEREEQEEMPHIPAILSPKPGE